MTDYDLGLDILAQIRGSGGLALTAATVRLRMTRDLPQGDLPATFPSVAKIRGRMGSLARAYLLCIPETHQHSGSKAPDAFWITPEGQEYLARNRPDGAAFPAPAPGGARPDTVPVPEAASGGGVA
jgi:hypothetical protein